MAFSKNRYIDGLKERNEILEQRCARYRTVIRTTCDISALHELFNNGLLSVNDYRYLNNCTELKEVDENISVSKSKPPLGVMPKEVWDRKRQQDLAEAMVRYLEAGMKIPSEWIKEYNEISDGLKEE